METTEVGLRKTSKRKNVATWFSRIILYRRKIAKQRFFSRKNVLRGLHAEPWDKYISVADEGKVLGAWVDLREGETLGILTKQLLMPQKESLFLVVLLTVSKFCLIRLHTAIL